MVAISSKACAATAVAPSPGVHRRDRAARIRNGGRTGAYLGNGDKGALVVAVSVAGEYQCPAFKLGGKP